MSLFNDMVSGLAHLHPRRQLSAEDEAVYASNRHRARQQAKDAYARRSQ